MGTSKVRATPGKRPDGSINHIKSWETGSREAEPPPLQLADRSETSTPPRTTSLALVYAY